MRKRVAIIILLFFIFPLTVFSATDGTLGPTSTGSVTITISTPPVLQITKIGDLDMGTWSGNTTNEQRGDNVCVYTNDPSGEYRVTATGDGPGGAFELRDSSVPANTLSYIFRFNNVKGNSGSIVLTAGVTSSTFTGASTDSLNCSGNTNAHIRAVVAHQDMAAVPAGTYTGTVSVVVEPG